MVGISRAAILKWGCKCVGCGPNASRWERTSHEFKSARLINLIEKRHKSNVQMVGISRAAILKWGWQ
jgi:hypothetical protein